MHEHGPNCLEGPIRGSHAWWRGLAAAPAEALAPEVTATPAKHDQSAIRLELVQRIRREIEAGTYDTAEKWEAALDRLLQRLDTD